MNSKSQAGQDRYVTAVLNGKRDGFYLDVGANNPVEISNSFALETDFGWYGLLVDNSPESMQACEKLRKGAFYLTDASKPQDWLGALAMANDARGQSADYPRVIDYLSADIDGATLAFLQNFPLDKIHFRVLTVETDVYRNGAQYRYEMRQRLAAHGYELIAGDVKDQGLPFEDWWVMPGLVDMRLAEKFRSNGKEWQELFK